MGIQCYNHINRRIFLLLFKQMSGRFMFLIHDEVLTKVAWKMAPVEAKKWRFQKVRFCDKNVDVISLHSNRFPILLAHVITRNCTFSTAAYTTTRPWIRSNSYVVADSYLSVLRVNERKSKRTRKKVVRDKKSDYVLLGDTCLRSRIYQILRSTICSRSIRT